MDLRGTAKLDVVGICLLVLAMLREAGGQNGASTRYPKAVLSIEICLMLPAWIHRLCLSKLLAQPELQKRAFFFPLMGLCIQS